MMNRTQVISAPFGITVFGSAMRRVEPDVAVLTFAVSRLARQPPAAFHETRTASQAVRRYLEHAQIMDVGASHIKLAQSVRQSGSEKRVEGYLARVAFSVVLTNLARLEDVMIGIIAAGVNEIQTVDFQTTRVKELRREVRQHAVTAAREKAELYCGAAGMQLGTVMHIEDISPESLRNSEAGHLLHETQPMDDGVVQAFNPHGIVVSAAVMVAFAFKAPS